MYVCMYISIQFEVSVAPLLSYIYEYNTNSDNIVSVTECGIKQENKYLKHDPTLQTATDG
jgi:uncharacterized membrane protein YkgB